MHAAGGMRLADALYLEVAGADPDVNATFIAEAMDTAIAGIVSAVGEVNRRLNLTDRAENDRMVEAALAGFRSRWAVLSTGRGVGTA